MSVALDTPQKTLNPGRNTRLLKIIYILPEKNTAGLHALPAGGNLFLLTGGLPL